VEFVVVLFGSKLQPPACLNPGSYTRKPQPPACLNPGHQRTSPQSRTSPLHVKQTYTTSTEYSASYYGTHTCYKVMMRRAGANTRRRDSKLLCIPVKLHL